MKRQNSRQDDFAAHRAQGRRGDCRHDGRHRLPDGLGAEPQGRHAQPHRHVLFDAPRHRPAGEPGSRLQGRDVGGRPSGPDEPHGQRSELDRHRRHGDLADQGRGAAGRAAGGRDRQDQELGRADAALHGRHLRRQGSLAPGRLAVRVHVSRRDGRNGFADRQDRLRDLRARASTTPTRWASARTWSAARSPPGPT